MNGENAMSAKRMIEIAGSQAGYLEKRTNANLDQFTAPNDGNGNWTKFGRWYGLNPADWCEMFISWCADQCGYIETGVIPKYAGCVNGVNWFKDRGQWADNDIEPAPGMIIFFDWDNKGSSGPQDGESDHTGIVERVEDGIVYTVEGNSGDSCRENHYAVGYYEILGYGIPAY